MIKTKIIGLAHIMLPSSVTKKIDNEAKYADTAIDKLLSDMYILGANKIYYCQTCRRCPDVYS